MTKKVWVLADDRAGNVSQVIGVAEALGLPYEVKNIKYNTLAKLPNFLIGASLVAITKESALGLIPPYPDIVIGAGRKTAPIARFIKKNNPNKTFLVQLMYPGDFGAKDFDLIAVPNHDVKAPDLPNIFRITGAAHKINHHKLNEEKEKWEPVFANLPSPKIALIVGGATKNKKFTEDMAVKLIKIVTNLPHKLGFNNASFLITTSRRTPVYLAKRIANSINFPKFFYKWGDVAPNPYLGFLA